MGFHYANTETRLHKGKHVVRRVVIKGGSGVKSVTHRVRNQRRTFKKALRKDEIAQIKGGKFIKGLFSDLSDRV